MTGFVEASFYNPEGSYDRRVCVLFRFVLE